MNCNEILNIYDDCYMVCDIQNGKVLELYPEFEGVNLPCNILNILRQKKFQLDINALREIDHFLAIANENDCLNVRCKDAWYCLELKRGKNDEEILHLYNLRTAMDMIVQDIAQTKTDTLTGVLEKSAIEIYISNYIHNNSLSTSTLFLLDLDYFKNINDYYGHLFGDRVIQAVAEELDKLCGNSGKVGRIGGDEFMLFVKHDLDRLGMKNVARLIRYVLENLNIDGKPFSCSATIGVSQYPKDGKTYQELFEACDKALYRGKCKGRDCHIIYDPALHENVKDEEIISKFESLGALASTNFIDHTLKTLMDDEYDPKYTNLYKEIAEYFMLDRIVTVEFDGFIETRYAKLQEKAGANKYQNLDYEEYVTNFNEDVFYVNDSTTWKKKNIDVYFVYQSVNVYSFIQILLRDKNDEPYGFISFESQINRRVWQRGDINYLSIIAKIINNFFNK